MKLKEAIEILLSGQGKTLSVCIYDEIGLITIDFAWQEQKYRIHFLDGFEDVETIGKYRS